MHIVFLRQNACYNIFCRRFSDASRYRNNGYIEQTSVPFSQVTQRLSCIFNKYQRLTVRYDKLFFA